MADRKNGGSRADLPQPALEDMPLSLVVKRRENRLLVDGAGFADSESREHRHSALGITCVRDTVGLDSHHATFRRYSRRLPGNLLDCCAAVGVHDPRQSDDSSGAGMLQAYGPDVRFGEYAAVALLLQDGSSTGHNDGCDTQPASSSNIASSCGSSCSDVAAVLEPVSQQHFRPPTKRIPT
jgi:hypothetical protein